MSGQKKFKEQADEGFVRAVYDLQSDVGMSAGVLVSIALERTKRRGVYEVVITGRPSDAVWQSASIVTYRREWPRSEVATLAAAVFQAMNAFDVLLGQEMMGEQWVAKTDPWQD